MRVGPASWGGRERLIAAVVVAVGTLIAVVAVVALERRAEREALRGDAGVAAQATRGVVEEIAGSIRGLPGAVDEDGRLSARRFARLARDLLGDPSINAVSHAVRVNDPDRAAFERRSGVRARDPSASGKLQPSLRRNQYLVTVDVRPTALRTALGVDVLADPSRATAARAARDRGRAQVSRPVTLVVSRTTGLIVYAPLYRGGTPPATREARRQAFTGVVGVSFQAGEIESGVLAQLDEKAQLRILDREALVTGPAAPLDGEAVTIPIVGRRWTVEVARDFGVPVLPILAVLAVGVLVGLVVDLRLRQFSTLRAASEEQHRLAAERELALTQSRFLAEAGAVLDASLDTTETLQRLADLVVPELADWCFVTLVGATSFSTVAIAHRDPEKVRLAFELQRRWPPDRSRTVGVGHVIATGEPELIPEVSQEVLEQVAVDPEHLRTMEQLAVGSAMVLPLVARGRILGALTFASDRGGHRFGEEDLDYATQLARRAALSVDNAELHGRTVRTARTLQAGLLPPALPRIPDVALAARYNPVGEDAEVGGDFYDVHALDSGGWGITVGDVCGKGAEAAALTALIRYTLRAVAEDGPSVALRRLNEAVLHQRPEGTFATLVHIQAVPDGDDLRLRFACAGHPSPVIRRGSGELELLGGAGPLIGAFGGLRWQEHTAVLAPGDAVALYTDGVLEAGDRPIDAPALRDRLAGVGPGAEAIATAIESIAVSAPRAGRDDVAVLVVERLAPVGTVRYELEADALAPGRARELIEPHLGALAPDRREAARLLVTETVTNAVRHGTPPMEPVVVLVTELADGVRVEVRDQGAGMRTVPPAPSPGAGGGYGLQLVGELSDRWGWSGAAGTSVWFELDAADVDRGDRGPESRPVGAA